MRGTSVTLRPYAGPADLRRLREFVARQTASPGPVPPGWHVGDLDWGIYQNTVFDPAANLRLAEAAGGDLVGFAWFRPPDVVEVETRRDHAPGDTATDALLDWAETRRAELAEPGEALVTLSTGAFDADVGRVARLTGRGYERQARHYVRFRRALDTPIGEPALPAGFTVRHVAGEAEFAARVDLHRDAWHPSRVTVDAYRRLRAAPGYTPELDLVAVAPDGGFAAYCIGWLDQSNRVGLFEPVGARPAYRRRGLARVVTLEGLRRLREHGMASGVVRTPDFNTNAVGLYGSAGFDIAGREHVYVKRLPASG